MSRSIVTREKTAQCPECYRWHDLYWFQPPDEKRKYLMFCSTKHKAPKKILVPYKEIRNVTIPEYRIAVEYVFVKDGSFKIVKKSEYQQPRLFD